VKGETMSKYIYIVLVLIFVNGCGSKEDKPKPTVTNTLEHRDNHVSSEPTDFVPEHIRRSTIEVVPH